ncbi:MAG: cobalamin-binding protein [Oscillospiraceae bacterium]|nr:cobalamin-binding protein [Oscillospiraceae bacterium]
MAILEEISGYLQKGRTKLVKQLVTQALEEGMAPQAILEDGLLSGMAIIGEKFKNNEVFVPEVLVAARAMNAGTELLKPHLMQAGVAAKGTAVIGTVKGDLHDIGKNLVKMMIESKGLTVIDLGVDVGPEAFVQAAVENNAQIVCCSALLTTTMREMKDVVDACVSHGIRDKVKIMVGGAPLNQEFCDSIGADCYTEDATSAAEAALAYVS